MKTIILILVFFGSFFCNAQKVSIYYVNPGMLCPGDTISIMFTWDNKLGYANFFIYGIGQTSINNVLTSSFYSLPKVLIGTDTVYLIKIKTLSTFGIGPATVASDLVNTKPIWFLCQTTGLQEPQSDHSQQIYTPLYGNILIEQAGNRRRKVVIVE